MPKENTLPMIVHEPIYALSEILALKTVPVLRQMANGFRVKGCSGMNKSELISSVAAVLPNEKEMADNLTLISDEEWALFQKAADVTEVIEDGSSDVIPILLLGIGYLAAFQHGGKTYHVMPDEIKATFHKLMHSGYGGEWTYITTLNKYARAATSLYGAITLDDFVEIYNRQNDRKTSIDDVCNLLLRFIATDEGYCFWDEYIVMDGFEENDFKDVEDLVKAAASKPRYLPSKEKFLQYADDTYFELTPQMVALKDYIVKKLRVNDSSDVYSMLAEIHCLCSQEADMQPIMEVFNRRGISLNNKEQINELMRHITGVMNNTRLWLNNGHTPDELYTKMEKPHMKPLPDQSEQIKNEPRRSTKVGRNEPCPCGSGKKYKKCCGW